jgi:hypothetical protein
MGREVIDAVDELDDMTLLFEVERVGGQAIVADVMARLRWDQGRFNKSFGRLSHGEHVLTHNTIALTEAGRACFNPASEIFSKYRAKEEQTK